MHTRNHLVFGLTTALLLLCNCGGGSSSSPPPPPPPDFAFTVAPATLAATVGTTSPPAIVSITGQNGFSGTVTVSLTGLGAGITSSPASPFTLVFGTSQEITFSIVAGTITGNTSVQFTATSGSLSKSSSLTLAVTPAPVIKTFQSGSMLFMEADTGEEMARVGLLTSWGGSITEVSLNGVNYVNANDPGREVQAELWDGNTPDLSTPGFWGTVQAGDHDYNGSPVLTQTVTSDSIYIKTQPLHWIPEYFGGGSGNPAPSDIYLEQWLTPVPGHGRAFRIHYKITHFGTDTHANAGQEYPAVYINRGFDTFLYYGGTNPWTYDALSTFTMPDLPKQGPLLATPERWAAYVDHSNSGITVYTPGSFPWTHGFNAPGDSPNGTNYFVPTTPFTWAPGAVLESNIYVIAGPVSDARAIIYELRHEETSPSPFSAVGNVELPQSGDTISGSRASVGGWAFGTSPIQNVAVFMDGALIGTATYGTNRPDIPAAFPGESNPDVGFEYSLDTTKFPNGPHSLIVQATDANGHLAIFPTIHVSVAN